MDKNKIEPKKEKFTEKEATLDKSGNFKVVGKDNLSGAEVIIAATTIPSAQALSRATGMPVAVSDDLNNLVGMLNSAFPSKPVLVAGERGNANAYVVAGSHKDAKAVYPTFALSENNTLKSFGDLYEKSKLGKDAIDRQLSPIIREAMNNPSITKMALGRGDDSYIAKQAQSRSKSISR